MGPEGFQDAEVFPAHRRQRRPRRLGEVRLRQNAANTAGASCWRRRKPDRKIGFGAHKGEPVWQEVPGEYRALLRRLMVIQGDTEPASVEQQRHLGKTAPSSVRPAQSVSGQRRGRPPFVGDGVSAAALLRPRRPRRSRDAAESAFRQRRHAAHPRRIQRTDAGLAVVLHVHELHRPRRQDAARSTGAIGLRSAVANVPLHADRRRSPHVRRQKRRRTDSARDMRGDERPRASTIRTMSPPSVASASSICRRCRRRSTSTIRSRSTCSVRRSPRTPPMRTTPASRGVSTRIRIDDDHQLQDATYRVLQQRATAAFRLDRRARPVRDQRAAARRLHRRLRSRCCARGTA